MAAVGGWSDTTPVGIGAPRLSFGPNPLLTSYHRFKQKLSCNQKKKKKKIDRRQPERRERTKKSSGPTNRDRHRHCICSSTSTSFLSLSLSFCSSACTDISVERKHPSACCPVVSRFHSICQVDCASPRVAFSFLWSDWCLSRLVLFSQ